MGLLAQAKQHDYGLPLIVDLNYRDQDLDLTDTISLATNVVFIMTLEGATTPSINRVSAAVTNVDTAARVVTVQYDWHAGDTDVAGTYRGEFEFTLTGGAVTAPTGGYVVIEIIPDLG